MIRIAQVCVCVCVDASKRIPLLANINNKYHQVEHPSNSLISLELFFLLSQFHLSNVLASPVQFILKLACQSTPQHSLGCIQTTSYSSHALPHLNPLTTLHELRYTINKWINRLNKSKYINKISLFWHTWSTVDTLLKARQYTKNHPSISVKDINKLYLLWHKPGARCRLAVLKAGRPWEASKWADCHKNNVTVRLRDDVQGRAEQRGRWIVGKLSY